MKLLQVDSSISGNQSASRQLTAEIVASLKKADPSAEVVYHDLAAEPLAHLSAAEYAVFLGDEPRDAATKREAERGARMLDDFLAADIIVVGAPMYNFSLPTQLKAWLDRLVVAGKTFRFTAAGPEGLANGKRVIVASTRGGFYSEGHTAAVLDHQESYLQGLFEFIGITDISFVRAEGLGISPESRKAAMDSAAVKIRQFAA